VRRLRKLETTVHLSNQHLGRYALHARTRFVITVHDLIRYFDRLSDDPLIHRPNRRDQLTIELDCRAIQRADAVIAVSAATGRDVVEHLGVPPERVFVVHNGLDHDRFRPVADRPFSGRYILYVGTEQPRKNIATLLRAFRHLKDDDAAEGLTLVKIGCAGGCEAPFREHTERLVDELGLRKDVVFTGHVDDDALPAWYSHAECLVLPSLYEGFGNPALEGMACGCPVVVSDTAALTEVVGEAGLSVPAIDATALAKAIQTVLTRDALRVELRQRGIDRARGFTWERAAEETLDVYASVLHRSS